MDHQFQHSNGGVRVDCKRYSSLKDLELACELTE